MCPNCILGPVILKKLSSILLVYEGPPILTEFKRSSCYKEAAVLLLNFEASICCIKFAEFNSIFFESWFLNKGCAFFFEKGSLAGCEVIVA
jgi:hypothetical protein